MTHIVKTLQEISLMSGPILGPIITYKQWIMAFNHNEAELDDLSYKIDSFFYKPKKELSEGQKMLLARYELLSKYQDYLKSLNDLLHE